MNTYRNQILYQFTMQRLNAERRGIPWRLTFGEWLRIWNRSGKLPQRGRLSDQYCMARFGDAGAYEVGNVRIISSANNHRERNLGRRLSEETKAKVAAAKRGKPRPDLAQRNRERRGVPLSEEHRAAVIAAIRARGPHSAQTKERIQRALKRYWNRRKRNG